MESQTKNVPTIRPDVSLARGSLLTIVFTVWIALASLALAQNDTPVATTGAVQPDLLAMGHFQDSRISESSGLAWAAVPEHVGAFWTINDSGHDPDLFLVSNEGATLCRFRLKKADNRDWEAMCQFEIDGVSHLAIADVGDNALKRRTSTIYVIAEPKNFKDDKEKKSATGYEFRFGDDAVNCESVSFDRDSESFLMIEKIFISEKRKRPPGVFSISWQALVEFQQSAAPDKTPPVATRIGDFPVHNITGMSFSPDNRRLVARGYFLAHLIERREEQTWPEAIIANKPTIIPLPIQSQGEAICFAGDDTQLILTSEQVGATIWRLSLDGK